MHTLKKTYMLAAALLCALCTAAAVYTPQSLPKPGRGAATPYVINPDGVLSAQTQAALDARLRAHADSTGTEVVVVAVTNVQNADIDGFANQLFELWGIGSAKTHNGVLLAVARDDRRYVLRTGKGAETVLTDVDCARIGRNIIEPAFLKNDFDGGVSAAIDRILLTLDDPGAAAALNDPGHGKNNDDESIADVVLTYFRVSCTVTALMLVWLLWVIVRNRNAQRYTRAMTMQQTSRIFGWMTFFFMFVPVLAWLPARWLKERWRNGPHKCPNCGAAMQKLDEETDNRYLSPAQDAEERLNSVDYDVWLCPQCNQNVVYAFKNPYTPYDECAICHARTATLEGTRTLVQPTRYRDGVGEKTYVCHNCKNRWGTRFKIARQASPVIIGGGGGAGGFGGGGGFGGFGGGRTGGGGASGGW